MLNLYGEDKFKTAMEISGLPEDVCKIIEQRFSQRPGREGGMHGGPGSGAMQGESPPDGGMPPGGEQPSSGRHSGPGDRHGSGDFNPLKQFEAQTVWLKIRLAKNQ
jgi:hypothetical protein